MIVLDKDRILEDYFIDENAVITDQFGNVQKQYLRNGRQCFKQQYVHKIMLNTFVGVRDRTWVVHHLDCNPLNNKLENLVYLTKAEHNKLHKIGNKNLLGKHHSTETKEKMSSAHKGKPSGYKGKHLSEETKQKLSSAHKGKHLSPQTIEKIIAARKGKKFFNNGVKNILCKSDEVPAGFVVGRINR